MQSSYQKQNDKMVRNLKDRLTFSYLQDELEDEETAESSASTQEVSRAAGASASSNDCDRKKPFKSRLFKTQEKYLDFNENVTDSQRDLLPRISSKRSLSSEDLPRNFERYPGQYINMQEQSSPDQSLSHYSRMKRESFDSTMAQRPFSPCSTLAASSDQFSLCEEEIVLLSPRFGGISSQRRASDGMVQRIPMQWNMQESNQGLSNSSTDINRTCSRASSRPATPVSPLIKIKASGGFRLPSVPKTRRPMLQELPSITISDNSESSSQSSLDSIQDEQSCPFPKQSIPNASEVRIKQIIMYRGENPRFVLESFRKEGSMKSNTTLRTEVLIS
jgi:hypothetical protein